MRTLSIPLHREMDRVLTDLLGSPSAPLAPIPGALACNLSELDEAFQLSVDLPGVAAEDVELTMEDQVLKLQVRRPAQEGVRLLRRERWEGSLRRTLTLPAPVDDANIQAELKNGVLQVTLPKVPEARPHRIQIQEN